MKNCESYFTTILILFLVSAPNIVSQIQDSLIAFESERSDTGIGQFEVYIMNGDGTAQTRLTNNSAYDGMPNLSPDGEKIAFVSTRDGNFEIYFMNIDGTNITRKTNNTAFDFAPKWSPDGSKLLYYSDVDGNDNIYAMDGSNLIRLTDDPASDIFPDWSPDGNQIAFTSDRNGNREIYFMNSDGTNQVQKTFLGYENYHVDWSPDGEKIAFMTDSYTNGNNYDICTINIDGSNQKRLTNHWGHDEMPEWSPDGSRIAFGSSILGADEIHIMNSNDGSNVQRLTNSPGHDFPHDWKSFGPSGIENTTGYGLKGFKLYYNYPNPFNPSTTINFQIQSQSFVTLKIYDVLGNEVAELVNEVKPTGEYQVEFKASGLTSGIYFYQLQAANFSQTKKMLLIK